jgi:hypothetical protein
MTQTKEEIPDFDKWKAYQDDQTAPMRESHKFIIEKAREYPPFTPHGLNQLPYALMPAVALCMESFAEQLTRQKDERIEELEKALDEIMYPVKYMQMRAKEQGAELNGYMAVQLSDSPSHLKQIAQRVMNKQ